MLNPLSQPPSFFLEPDAETMLNAFVISYGVVHLFFSPSCVALRAGSRFPKERKLHDAKRASRSANTSSKLRD